MPPTLWRVMTVVLLLGLFSLGGEQWLSPAEAASKDQRRDQSLSSKRSRNSTVNIAPTTLPPAVIQNVRTAFSPDLSRLVLDLNRKTRVKKHLPSKEDGLIVEIPHAALSRAAQAKIAQGTLDGHFLVQQTSDASVTVTL
jgi:hypothetical protein